jgi:pectinesterase
MRKIFNTLASLFACSVLSLSAATVPEHKVKIVLVGDSTVTDGAGWGLGFKQFLDPGKTELVNTARGGRSSLSFINEGRWTNALALKGDYYLIQFGHNNQPGKPGRSTDMPTYEANLRQYVDEARAIGAQPILVTPLTRRQWEKEPPGKIRRGLAPWAESVHKVAAEKHVPLVDLHARSIELCESLGPEKCREFSPVKATNTDGKISYDGTHLKGRGYVMFARLVVDELRNNMPEVTPLLLREPLDFNPVASDSKYDAVVSIDGSGTHTNVQSAIAAAPDNGTNAFTILIKAGVYEGPVMIPKEKRHLRLVGEEVENTVLTWPYNVNEPQSSNTFKFNPGVIVLGDDFQARNLTIQNTAGDRGQALAMMVNADRAAFEGCRLLGWQDTLMVNHGYHYFTNCYIAGRVDFIYGSATAVFDHCEIHSKNGGYVTAASTPADREYGFVFLDCKLTGDEAAWVDPKAVSPAKSAKKRQAYLGRPWRANASVTFIRCEMEAHLRPEGWHNWGNITNETTARYAEYGSTGPGANPSARVTWAKALTEAEAKVYTVGNILKGKE